jgi:glutamine synthetase
MIEERYQANTSECEKRKAELYDSTVRPTMLELRSHIDELELVIDDDIWPLPKYRELLFAK